MRTGRRALLALAAAPALPRPAAARSPAVEMLVGAPAGTPTDLWARGAAPFLERRLPRLAVAVRNLPGRGGLEAVAQLLAAPADAKAIAVITTPALLVRAIEAGEAPPSGRVVPLASLVEEPVVLVAGHAGPADLGALRALGDRATIGTPPPGTAAHVASLRFDGKLDLPRLAFPSAMAARQAALSGHVAAAVIGLPEAIQGLREGRLTGLGLAAPRRSALLPDLPTLREQGVDLVALAQRGFAVAPTAAPDWRATLVAAIEAVAADPDFVEHCAGTGQSPRFQGPEAWARQLDRVDAELRQRWQQEPWLPRRA
ncbi:tripartite tricarboxylate transporter substrate-binding protein [Falsiroseomonas sp. CW058]|uniref:tripartite tricarboxylate transporter substrate-binding protein n=1 Tax=Falsiroseomonas sp. CW058 TaxID=3388664 RepID=UPI003D320EB0